MKNEGVIGDILRDINRTFPTHVLFRSSGGMGQIMLENVLRSLNDYFPDIGYCQVESPLLSTAGNELRRGRGHSGDHGPERLGLQQRRVEGGVDRAVHDDVVNSPLVNRQLVAVAGGATDVRSGGELHPAAADEGSVERGHPRPEAIHLHPATVHAVGSPGFAHADSYVRASSSTSTASATTPPSSSPSGS